jgi:hypothetical protein
MNDESKRLELARSLIEKLEVRRERDCAQEIEKLVEMGEAIVPLLIQSLDVDSPNVSVNILKVIREMRSKQAVPAVIEFMQNSNTPRLQSEAAETLGCLGDNSATIPLVETLENASSIGGVKQACVRSLVRLKDEKAIGPLCELLRNNIRSLQAVKVLQGFGNLGKTALRNVALSGEVDKNVYKLIRDALLIDSRRQVISIGDYITPDVCVVCLEPATTLQPITPSVTTTVRATKSVSTHMLPACSVHTLSDAEFNYLSSPDLASAIGARLVGGLRKDYQHLKCEEWTHACPGVVSYPNNIHVWSLNTPFALIFCNLNLSRLSSYLSSVADKPLSDKEVKQKEGIKIRTGVFKIFERPKSHLKSKYDAGSWYKYCLIDKPATLQDLLISYLLENIWLYSIEPPIKVANSNKVTYDKKYRNYQTMIRMKPRGFVSNEHTQSALLVVSKAQHLSAALRLEAYRQLLWQKTEALPESDIFSNDKALIDEARKMKNLVAQLS